MSEQGENTRWGSWKEVQESSVKSDTSPIWVSLRYIRSLGQIVLIREVSFFSEVVLYTSLCSWDSRHCPH